MKEKKIDNLKLEDEDLKKVSGGGFKTEYVNYCVYCEKPHMMTKNTSVGLTVGNMTYTNCDRYVCELRKLYFYVVVDGEGVKHCYDQYLVDRTKEYFG